MYEIVRQTSCNSALENALNYTDNFRCFCIRIILVQSMAYGGSTAIVMHRPLGQSERWRARKINVVTNTTDSSNDFTINFYID